MTPRILYRIAAALLLLFAVGHTLGFRQVDPEWKVDALIAQMRSLTFLAQGQTRAYWDFFVGFGLFVSIFQVLSAVLAWQLSSLPQTTVTDMPLIRWGVVVAFAGITYLSWRYFFPAPLVLSALITLCFGLAAWKARRL